MNARENLKAIYLDWVNNYLSIGHYADKNALDFEDARVLLNLAHKVYDTKHPDA